MHWSAGYIGIPFKEQGRSKDGADCWGLVKIVMKEIFNQDLPDFTDHPFDKKSNAMTIEASKPLVDAHEVEDKEEGRIVVMMSMGHPAHVGVSAGQFGVLHMERKMGAVLEPWYRLKYEIEGIYGIGKL